MHRLYDIRSLLIPTPSVGDVSAMFTESSNHGPSETLPTCELFRPGIDMERGGHYLQVPGGVPGGGGVPRGMIRIRQIGAVD